MNKLITLSLSIVICTFPSTASAMHVMEGFLPRQDAFFWLAAAVPFLLYGIREINRLVKGRPERKLLLGLAGAFIFVLSALKIPSVTGSCSHPTGVGLAAVLFGPAVSSVLSAIVLLFQALLLAHGGITTLGANTFSMGIAGAFIAWSLYHLVLQVSGSEKVALFCAAAAGDIATYAVTAGQLAWAFPDPIGGFFASFLKFSGIFIFTQIPLAISEGLLSVVVYNTLHRYADQGLLSLWGDKAGEKL